MNILYRVDYFDGKYRTSDVLFNTLKEAEDVADSLKNYNVTIKKLYMERESGIIVRIDQVNTNAHNLVNKIIGEDFYFDISYGMNLTNFTVNDLLEVNSNIVVALKEIQRIFDEKMEDNDDYQDTGLRLVIDADGNIGITFSK